MDVKCVFLNMNLDQKIYMKQLDGYEVLRCKYLVYKLKETIYGLKQVRQVSTILIFFKHFFSYKMCTILFWKLKRNLTLMIRRKKRFELMKIAFINDLDTFGSNVFLTLKIIDFENVILTKNCSYLCDRGHE